MLSERERTSSTQVVVAIFRSLAGEGLEDYAVRLAQVWRIGQKGLDNGVVFLVFLDDRKLRLEVGYGLEATLTDAIASSIIRDVVAPRFREGRLADGIAAGLDAIAQVIAGTYQRPAGAAPARARSAWPAGAGGLAPIGIAIMVLAGVPLLISSLYGTRLSRRHGWTGGRGGWSRGDFGGSGCSGGGGSSSSSSSGSFSGGGGSFGGGGASGSW